MTEAENTIHVIVNADISNDILQQLRAISSRLRLERYYPNVPDSAWATAEILFVSGRDLPEPAEAPRLRWIQTFSAGLDHILDLPIVQAEDVEITSTSGMHATQMAEFSLMMMLAFEYKLPKMLEFQSKATWPEKRYDTFAPQALRGQTLGIVGYGSIGRELARLADALGMVVVATKRNVKQTADEESYAEAGTGDPAGDIPTRLYPPEALASMLSVCDYVVITLPRTKDTYHSFNQEMFDAMKKTAVLVNVGRGGVVDEDALISTLAAGRIAGAALDVFEEEPLPSDSPLWGLDNIIIAPHISGYTVRYDEKAAALFAENLERYLNNEPLFNRLDRGRGY